MNARRIGAEKLCGSRLFRAGCISSVAVLLMFFFAGAPLEAATFAFQIDSGGTLLTGLEYYAPEEANSNDVSVRDRTSTVTGSPTWGSSSGKVGNGMALTAGANGAQLNGLPTWTDANPWSFGFWYRVPSIPASDQDYLTIQQGGLGQFGAAFRQMPNGTQRYFLIKRGLLTLAECVGTTVFTPASWYHIVVTYAGTGGQLTAYINGSQDCTVTESGSATASNGNIGVNLEVDNSQVNLDFNIDELGIWSKVLSWQERADLYNAGNGQTMVAPVVGFIWKGTWSDAVAYDAGDAIAFNGSSYVSLTSDNTGNQPDVSPDRWELIAQKGDTGSQGPPGPTGPAGPAGANGSSGSVIGGNYANSGNNRFLIPWGDTTSATEANANVPVPSGVARKLVVSLTVAPGVGHSATVTVRRNGVGTSLTCTVVGAATTCADTADSVAFSDGDLLSILYTENSAVGARIRFGFEYSAP
jgi:hypothetical protein